MATDFFDRQDHARRQTRRLVVMFALAVVAIILAIYLVVAVACRRRASRRRSCDAIDGSHAAHAPPTALESGALPVGRAGNDRW